MKIARMFAVLMLAFVAPAAPAAAQSAEPACSAQRYGAVQLFVGVSTETVAFTCGSVVSTAHVIRVDLRAPGLSFLTSRSADGGPGAFNQELTAGFLQRTHSQVAFNGNLFTNCCCRYVPGGHTLRPLCRRQFRHSRAAHPAALRGAAGSLVALPDHSRDGADTASSTHAHNASSTFASTCASLRPLRRGTWNE